MKKRMTVFLAMGLFVCALAGILGCGGGDKYAEVKDVIGQTIAAQEAFIASVNKATTPAQIVTAIDQFSKSIQELNAKAKAVDNKHPELKTGKLPPDIETLVKKSDEVGNKLGGEAMQKVATQFGKNKAVQEALKRFADAMQAMK